MKLSAFKTLLNSQTEINLVQANGSFVPKHFHITEVGLTTKHYIDCGGTERTDKKVSFQVWVEQDIDHRLTPEKLIRIINLSERLFNGEDLEVEVEYQTDSIGRYKIDFDGSNFILSNTYTDCLAKDNCGIPSQIEKVALADMQNNAANSCTPGGGCC